MIYHDLQGDLRKSDVKYPGGKINKCIPHIRNNGPLNDQCTMECLSNLALGSQNAWPTMPELPTKVMANLVFLYITKFGASLTSFVSGNVDIRTLLWQLTRVSCLKGYVSWAAPSPRGAWNSAVGHWVSPLQQFFVIKKPREHHTWKTKPQLKLLSSISKGRWCDCRFKHKE